MSDTSEEVTEPQTRRKRKSADARQAEADGFAVIEICGLTLTIPAGNKVPMRALLRFRGLNDDMTPLDGDPELLGSAELLGSEQWAAFLAQNPTVADFQEIGKQLSGALGN